MRIRISGGGAKHAVEIKVFVDAEQLRVNALENLT